MLLLYKERSMRLLCQAAVANVDASANCAGQQPHSHACTCRPALPGLFLCCWCWGAVAAGAGAFCPAAAWLGCGLHSPLPPRPLGRVSSGAP